MATRPGTRSSRVLMPWEYNVCKDCFMKNMYSVWLVWYGCFNRKDHHKSKKVIVAIDTDNIKLVQVREPRNLKLCADICNRNQCKEAHSQLELDCWVATLEIQRNHSALMAELQALKPVRSSKVCRKCLSATPNFRAVWLTWLTCTDSSHDEEYVTVITSNDSLAIVRELNPDNQQQLTLCKEGKSCKKESCKLAHSQEELGYWKWTKVTTSVYKQLGDSMSDKFAYPHERSDVLKTGFERSQLSVSNYKSKYHKLVYLDNLEHARKMVADCDGELTIKQDGNPKPPPHALVHVSGMNSTNMNYAFQKPAPSRACIAISYNHKNYYASGVVVDKTEHSLIVKLDDTLHLPLPTTAHVHFEYNHWKFQRLHSAIDYAQPDLIERLIQPAILCDRYPAIPSFKHLVIDDEYQPRVLRRILAGGCGSPFLLLGPFGTGKTHLLMAAIVTLVNIGCKILVCTHHNRGADTLCEKLSKELVQVLRLYPKDLEVPKKQFFNKSFVNNILWCPVLVTTFTTALKLKEKMNQIGELWFTHIIIDEGAQSREPEALGALLMADTSTHIIIAGDNKQVGPKVSVFSEKANENGLGESLIERLLKLYEQHLPREELNNLRYSVLTNYRCHHSILMLASSLFYGCNLQPRSSSEAHPLAPYPIVFQCSSLKEDVPMTSSAINEQEAMLLVQKALEFILAWPVMKEETPKVAFLAGSDAQLDCLRSQFAKLNHDQGLRYLPCSTQFSLTYTIQGSEYDAVFLSTHEPTDRDGRPLNTVRSICNEYVFNTVITRSRSLIFAVGNPFKLLEMSSHFSVNCWSELIQRCITCQSFHLPQEDKEHPPIAKAVQRLSEIVFSTQYSESTTENDSCNAGYRKLFLSQKDERTAAYLTKNPVPIIGTRYWCDSDDSDDEEQEFATGQLELLSHRKGKIVSDDPDVSGTIISCAEERRLHFSGQTVKVSKKTKQIVVDLSAVKEVNKKYFGLSFLCHVKADNMLMLYPFNKTIPILKNIPTLTKKFAKEGVVCFHPNSIGNDPKACNFIPKECAVNMVFSVTYLRWRKKFPHPLGIVTGALPCGTSVYTGDLILKAANNIPRTDDCECSEAEAEEDATNKQLAKFNSVITIDPQGSKDHDDALSCKQLNMKNKLYIYEVGVHITDVQKFVSKDSELDKAARQRGCSVYSSTAQCVSHMLPKRIVEAASILPRETRDAFSVIAKVSVEKNHNDTFTVSKFEKGSINVLKSKITSTCELTYEKAHELLVCREDSTLESKKLKVLWAVACFFREKRLKKAALHMSVDDLDQISHPESHILVEELMIWANQVVAKKLFDHDKLSVILRCQPAPDKAEFEKLVKTQGQHLAVSLDLQQHVSASQECPAVQMLHETVREMEAALKEGSVRKALHLVQFEHVQPQVAVAHALFNMIRQRASYCAATEGDSPESYSHSSLQCSHYTHFTSPIRRFVDLVIQRMLLAVLNDQFSPYEFDELKEISEEMGVKHREADRYEDERKCLDMALQFQQCSQEYLYFVKKVEAGELKLTFHDVTLKAANRHIKSVHLKHLNAASIPQRESSVEPDADDDDTSHAGGEIKGCKWKVKYTSVKGTLTGFLSNRDLQPTAGSDQIKLNVLTGEQPITRQTDWNQQALHASIKPFTQSVSMENWRKLQEYVSSPPAAASVQELLPSPLVRPNSKFPDIHHSPLWIYELQRPLQSCEVLRVQLTGSFNRSTQLISPSVQLLEVGPNLRVCIQHNSSPAECFTDTSSHSKPAKHGHASTWEYFQFWEQALLAEAATSSLTDAELMIITDVRLVWPKLRQVTDSQGQLFYQLPPPGDADRHDYCACLKLSKNFSTSSYDFFRIKQGDLMCVRCYDNHRADGDNHRANGVRGVLHMVVHSIEKKMEGDGDEAEIVGIDVFLKFVGERPNYISQQLSNSLDTLSYEIQLIQLTVPLSRVYRNLCDLKRPLSNSIAESIAKSIATGKISPNSIVDCPDLEQKLGSHDVVQVASSIWPIDQSGEKLNKYQQEALQLACCNRFAMIQGPPGTGKSVTGAHIAYALAMKLRKDVGKVRKKKEELNPCVMYCGPSQQSVNVVLDILTSSREVQASGLKIVRVYNSSIESKDYPGPKSNPLVFREVKEDGKCEEKFMKYALHHIIRRNKDIVSLDKELDKLKKKNKIPSAHTRDQYKKAVTAESIAVLQESVDIVLCTCNEAGSYRIAKSVEPVYCVIDECAMATEPECMVPIRRASNVVLIGDDKQLQPVLHNDDAKNMGMSTSLFESFVRAKRRPHMLKIQYRMHASLCEFPSCEFYDGKLETSPSFGPKYKEQLDRLSRFWPQGRDCPLVFCDVVGDEEENHTGHRGTARVGLESKRNTREARKIVEIARALISQHKVKPEEIAVITPYSAQKEEVKKQLKGAGRCVDGVTVKTITDAQGSEFGIVLLSTVRSLPVEMLPVNRKKEKIRDLGWRREHLGFITDKHQICVGITRCKYGLAIVGNRQLLTYDETWTNLIHHYAEKQCVVSGENFPKQTHTHVH